MFICVEDSQKATIMKSHKSIISVFLILIFIQISCRKENDCLCGVDNPETNLQWLKYRLDRMLCVEVYSLNFKGKEYVALCDCPGADQMDVIFDCEGNKTCELGGINGFGICNMPEGFSYEYYYENRKFVFSQPFPSANQ